MERKIVLKIGGSTLYDNLLNVNFELLKKIKTWYQKNIQEYKKMVFVTGGGNLSRDLQKRISSSIGGEGYLHNIAMSVTQTNATLIHGYLENPNAYLPKRLGDAFEYLMDNESQVLVSGGLKPGWSTDMDAAVFADIILVDRVLKISDIDFIYDSDPKENPNAKEIRDLSWAQYFDLFKIVDGQNHVANKNIPIDVGCAQFCKRKGISFFICGGKNLLTKNTLEEILEEGTLIHP